MTCRICGKEIEDGKKYCYYCGAQTSENSNIKYVSKTGL
jgi:rRNA maturation endonuclease Nob1